MEELKHIARDNGYSRVNDFLKANFGIGVSTGIVREILERSYLSQNYISELFENREYTDAELDAFYAENPNEIDLVDFRDFHFHIQLPVFEDEETDDDEVEYEGELYILDGQTLTADEWHEMQTEKYRLEAQEGASAMLAAITDEASFDRLAYENAPDYNKEAYTRPGAAIQSDIRYVDISNDDVRDWVFDPQRQYGDTTSFEGDNGFYVLFFMNRAREEYSDVSVRHILFQVDSESLMYSNLDPLAETLRSAETVLAEWEAGDRTEESFAELAMIYSQDPGSSEEGGLYTDVVKGMMIEPFEEWCFDPIRQIGDTGIVETEYGFHVMYFSGFGETQWKARARYLMDYDEYYRITDEILERYPIAENNSGMRQTENM